MSDVYKRQGLPYDWGGYMSLFQFDQQIAQGYGAGSFPEDGILSCTAGVDCSGFVSQIWNAGHTTTSGVDQISSVISKAQMLPGDIFNDAGNHMAMYSHLLGNGEPALYESVFYNVHYSMPGWSWLNGYIPRRYTNITGTTADDPSGTTQKPIAITSFPFVDSRNTAQSSSDVLDGCGAKDPAETGTAGDRHVLIPSPNTRDQSRLMGYTRKMLNLLAPQSKAAKPEPAVAFQGGSKDMWPRNTQHPAPAYAGAGCCVFL